MGDLGLWIQKSWSLPWVRSSGTSPVFHRCERACLETRSRSRERVGVVAHCPGQSRGLGRGCGGSAGTCSEHPLSFPYLPVALFCCENPDINELNLPKTCDISFSDPDDLLNFKLVICPDEVRARLTGFSGMAGDTTSSWHTWLTCQALQSRVLTPLLFLHRASIRAGSLCSVLR